MGVHQTGSGPVWCTFLNGGNGCVANDTFIPTASQFYPGAGGPAGLNVLVTTFWGHARQWLDPLLIGPLNNQVRRILEAP